LARSVGSSILTFMGAGIDGCAGTDFEENESPFKSSDIICGNSYAFRTPVRVFEGVVHAQSHFQMIIEHVVEFMLVFDAPQEGDQVLIVPGVFNPDFWFFR